MRAMREITIKEFISLCDRVGLDPAISYFRWVNKYRTDDSELFGQHCQKNTWYMESGEEVEV